MVAWGGVKLTTLGQQIIFIFINLLKWFRCQVRDSGFVQLNGAQQITKLIG